MSLLKYSDPLPDWSELDFINVFTIAKSEVKTLNRKSYKEKIFIGEGSCEVSIGRKTGRMKTGDCFEISGDTKVEIIAEEDCTVIHVGGRWSDETGSSGVFRIANSDIPENIGDPADYERTTEFDNHFHDCDEYWIIMEGSGLAVSEGVSYMLGPGSILATKMGDHHDLPVVYEEIKGVWFETTLKGKKRTGHLWNHTHTK